MDTVQRAPEQALLVEPPTCCGLVLEQNSNHAHDSLLLVGRKPMVTASLFAVAAGSPPPDPELRPMYEVFDVCGAEQFLKLHDMPDEVLLIGRAADRAHALNLDFGDLTGSTLTMLAMLRASVDCARDMVNRLGDPDVVEGRRSGR